MKKAILLTLSSVLVFSGCKETPKPEAKKPVPRLKRVVRITPLNDRFIELDDGSRYGMGFNLYDRLVSTLDESGGFIVLANEPDKISLSSSKQITKDSNEKKNSDRLKFDFAPVAIADVQAKIQELTFTHGNKGVRRFAGFTESFKTEFNDGDLTDINEYPPRSLEFTNSWFGTTFEPIGNENTNTIAGVDAGMEGELNLIVAGIRYKRDSYHATAKVESRIEILADQSLRVKNLDASGDGFLFALGATYRELSLDFGIVRRTALKETFDDSVEKMATEIKDQLFTYPFRTKIEKIGSEGIIINAGKREGVLVGDRFEHNAGGKITILEATEVFQIGSVAKVISGGSDLQINDVIEYTEVKITSKALGIASSASTATSPDNRRVIENPKQVVETKKIIIEPPEFHDNDGSLKKALNAKGFLLPYLLWRYSQYDQKFADRNGFKKISPNTASSLPWNLESIKVKNAWDRSITGKGITVAIIDSGVDYNHRNIGAAFSSKEKSGFDYIGYDDRAFDDNSHGTALAGIIAGQGVDSFGVAPDTNLLSYRVFDPYGVTTSAALYKAFESAIQNGAKIILCGWDTKRSSQALKKAIQLAEQHDVLVVVAAGDLGNNLDEIAHYPASYQEFRNLIRVGSINKALSISEKSGRFSNYSANLVDIMAPGEDLSVMAPRNEILIRSGTDLAAAHVAGALALVWSENPEMGAEDAQAKLLNMAQPVDTLKNYARGGRLLSLQ
ncbi:MAG: S8 family serine peptidase [Oligoflexia bacterium]|nr:S8 family serine peptidase [Oligoflexia bacterium]